MGWRNVWRNRRRSLVVISSIGFGIFAMILSMGIMNGFNVQMVENTIGTSLGHVAIHRTGWQDEMKLALNFTPSGALYSALKANPRVAGFAPRVKTEGIVRSSETSQQVLVVGIDPVMERNASQIYDYTLKEEGSRFLEPGDREAILISQYLAGKLELLTGDKTVLMLQDRNRILQGVGLRVTGLYRTPIDAFDKFVVFVPIRKLQEITGLGSAVSEITVRLGSSRDVDPVKSYLAKKTGDPSLEILTWKEMDPSLVRAVKLFDQMMYIFFAIIFVTVIFSVANTLIMAIMERFHEIGVMKSIGTRPSWIFALIMIEACFLGAVGLAAGTALGLAATGLLAHTGIDFSFYVESMRTWGTGSVIYPAIKALDMVVAGVIVLATTIIAALYPALKAARIKPLEALHYI
jgi:ABC-type lipoprotein release transport system permease subunit